jgi:K+-transporting ATPase c subunit
MGESSHGETKDMVTAEYGERHVIILHNEDDANEVDEVPTSLSTGSASNADPPIPPQVVQVPRRAALEAPWSGVRSEGEEVAP